MTDAGWSWRGRGRNGVTLIAVAATWAVLVGLIVLVDASPWLMGALALFTLPACLDWIANPRVGIDLDGRTLRWFAGRASGTVPTAGIDRIRLDTRLDLSVRTTVVMDSGQRIRLPAAVAPPHRVLEREVAARGIAIERHHFSVLG